MRTLLPRLLLAGLLAASLTLPAARAGGRTVIVNNRADDFVTPPTGSLREAVGRFVDPGDTIVFQVDGPIELREKLVIPPELGGITLTGPVTIDGRRSGNNSGIIQVEADDVTVRDISFDSTRVLTTGDPTQGGGASGFTVTDCTFRGRSVLRIVGTQDAIVTNCDFDVSRIFGEKAGIQTHGSERATLIENTVTTAYANDLADEYSLELELRDNDFTGEVLLASRSGVVTGNTFGGSRGLTVFGADREQDRGRLEIVANRAPAMRVVRTDVRVAENVLGAVAGKREKLVDIVLSIISFDQHGPTGPMLVEDNVITGGEFGMKYTDGVRGYAAGTVRRNRVTGSSGAGYLVNAAHELLFQENEAAQCGKKKSGVGMWIRDLLGPDVVIAGNLVTDTAGTGMIVTPTDEILVSGNTVRDSAAENLNVNLTGLPATVAQGTVRFEDNLLEGGLNGLFVLGDKKARAPADFVGNLISGAKRSGIVLERVNGVSVTGNEISDCGGGDKKSAGIEIRKGHGTETVLSDNVVTGTRGVGVRISVKGTVTLTDEKVTAGSAEGISVSGKKSTVTVAGATVEGNGGAGIVFARKAKGAVRGARLLGNGGAGVLLAKRSEVEISATTFVGNVGAGIDLEPKGVTPNGATKRANRNLDWPTDLLFDEAEQKLRGRTLPGATVEVFAVEATSREGNPGNGEGARFLGAVQASPAGDFTYPSSGDLECPEGNLLTVTATISTRDGRAVTSEFSEDVRCEPRPGLDWRVMASPTSEDLLGLWVVSETEAYAVGEKGTFIRFDGTEWKSIDTGVQTRMTGVAVRGPSDVLVTTGRVQRSDGASAPVDEFAPTFNDIVPAAVMTGSIWRAPDGQVFAGVHRLQEDAPGVTNRVAHYTGSDWVEMWHQEDASRAESPTNFQYRVKGIWGTSGSSVYCVTSVGSVHHWNSNSTTRKFGEHVVYTGLWTDEEDLSKTLGKSVLAEDLWGAGSELYVAGRTTFHFDGANWSDLETRRAHSVWADDSESVFIATDSPFFTSPGKLGGEVWRFDGTTLIVPKMPPGTKRLNRVRGVGLDALFAVGDDGTILRYIPPDER